MLTPSQKTTLKAYINSVPELAAQPLNSDGASVIAAMINVPASPDFWVWRTNVSRAEIYNTTSPDGTNWNWTTYKAQGVSEQNAWTQMFMGDQGDFSQANFRSGVASIFGGANAQTTHCLAMGRRKALQVEKVLAVGTGSAVSPAVMGFEGAIDYATVEDARNNG